MRISILGDSISTFAGVTVPAEGVYYDAYLQRISGVQSVQDTWWMQVLTACGGTLGVNCSVAGSMVTGFGPMAGTAPGRISALGGRGVPDRILVWMGANDWGFGAALTDGPYGFPGAYHRMLQLLQTAYPQAEILCGTLLRGAEAPDASFFNAEAAGPLHPYNDCIRAAVHDLGCFLADLSDCTYETVDGVHPSRAGMAQIAAAWQRAISLLEK